MRGIEHHYELPSETTHNLFDPSPDRTASGLELLPRSLDEALEVMEGSQLVRDTLGEHIFEWFLRNKRAEWDSYRTQVTPWELERYLPRW